MENEDDEYGLWLEIMSKLEYLETLILRWNKARRKECSTN